MTIARHFTYHVHKCHFLRDRYHLLPVQACCANDYPREPRHKIRDELHFIPAQCFEQRSSGHLYYRIRYSNFAVLGRAVKKTRRSGSITTVHLSIRTRGRINLDDHQSLRIMFINVIFSGIATISFPYKHVAQMIICANGDIKSATNCTSYRSDVSSREAVITQHHSNIPRLSRSNLVIPCVNVSPSPKNGSSSLLPSAQPQKSLVNSFLNIH